MSDTYECSKCGEDFTPTTRTTLLVGTDPETCPAAGGGGHQALATKGADR